MWALLFGTMDKAVTFYRDTLGFCVLGDVMLEGEEADRLTRLKGTKLRAVYLRNEHDLKGPLLELLHFLNTQLTNPGITEVAFWVKDIEQVYEKLCTQGVEFYSPPQLFELEEYDKVKAVYFWDPDGTTLELLQAVKE